MSERQSIEKINSVEEFDEMVSWQSSSYASNEYSMSEELMRTEEIPMLTSLYSPGSSLTNSSNILEHFDHSTTVLRHTHYKLFQKRFNKFVLSIEHMSIVSKIKLKYIS